MAHKLPNAEPADTSLTPLSQPIVRHDGWTAEKQTAFLRMLAATQSVSAAAKAVGMSRQSAYKLRARLEDGPFGAAWRLASQSGRSRLVEAALDRAINGVEVPHYWQGELIGTSRRYDERLTALLLNSGALTGAARVPPVAETEYQQYDLTRLLDRIAVGPEEWGDLDDESRFAWGDDGRAEESPPEEVEETDAWNKGDLG
ncbi:MAG: hypothetical protein AAFY51_07570 [Pseudomonadota bacterium]